MIESLVPGTVAVASSVDGAEDVELFEAERRLVEGAGATRHQEFATVRGCARRALTMLGESPQAVLKGARGEPQWPPGIVGSMTHCTGYTAAVVARASDVRGIGIDAEPSGPMPDGALTIVALASEQQQVVSLGSTAEICWDKLLFSAKESVFKCWYPATHIELGFRDAEVTFSPNWTNDCDGGRRGRFHVRLIRSAVTHLPTDFEGRWRVGDGFAMTAVVLPAVGGR